MAKPRIFISSTFYDLRYARVSLESFIKDVGYDPVLNERGNIPYSNLKQLQDYCYSEISKVNILVSIIGGRFGSASNSDEKKSISNMELKTAIELGKQVYIFIDSSVNAEYYTFKKNRDRDIEYTHVDDRRVYEFIEEMHGLSNNNQIFTFTEIPQIISYLKDQWAGLFENYLEQTNREVIGQAISRIEATAQTLNGLVSIFRSQGLDQTVNFAEKEIALNSVVLQNHPLFNAVRKELSVSYRVFFTNKTEFLEWLKTSRAGEEVNDSSSFGSEYFEYKCSSRKIKLHLFLSKTLFDSYENLKVMLPADWSEKMIIIKPVKVYSLDDEIPF